MKKLKIKDKIWSKEKHWFKFKFNLLFLMLGLLFTLLLVLEMTIWNHYIVLSLIYSFLSLVFYVLFFAPLIKEFYL